MTVAEKVAMENDHEHPPAVTDALTPFSDLRGLAVHDAQDLLTGHVFNVLTEAETGLIRFLDVELDGKGKHVLIPVGHARLEEGLTGRRVRLRAATLDDLEEVPAYHPEPALPGRDAARQLVAAQGRVFRGDRYYAHPAFDHRGLYAGKHPIVADDEAGQRAVEGLELLSASREFKLASGEPDIRGWPITDVQQDAAGTVADLIVDTEALTVRYLVAQRGADQILLPIGYVNFSVQSVEVPGLTAADLSALPLFEGLPLSRTAEEQLLSVVEAALDARNPFLRVDFSNRQMVP